MNTLNYDELRALCKFAMNCDIHNLKDLHIICEYYNLHTAEELLDYMNRASIFKTDLKIVANKHKELIRK